MRQKKAFTSSDLIVRFVAPAFWRFFITFSSLFGELSYNIKKRRSFLTAPLYRLHRLYFRKYGSIIQYLLTKCWYHSTLPKIYLPHPHRNRGMCIPGSRHNFPFLRAASIILTALSNHRWSTLSRISCVRPWFQNCVPIYPHVLRATCILSWFRFPQLGHSHTSFPSLSSTILTSPL